MRRTRYLSLLAVALLVLPATSAAAYDGDYDSSSPTTQFKTADGAVLSAPTTLTVEGMSTDDGSGILGVLVEFCSTQGSTCESAKDVNSACSAPCPGSYDWRVTVPDDLTEGRYTVTAYAVDREWNGDWDGVSIRVTLDRSPPATKITTPDGTIAAPSQGKITGKSTDQSSGISKVTIDFCPAGGSGCTTAEAAPDCSAGCPVSYEWTVPAPQAAGTYVATVRAVDNAGYRDGNPPSISLTVDGSPPATTIRTLDGSLLMAGQDKIEGTSVDNAAGTAKVLVAFCWNGDQNDCKTAESVPDCPSNCPLSYEWAIDIPDDLMPGPHVVTAHALDKVGNQESKGPSIQILAL